MEAGVSLDSPVGLATDSVPPEGIPRGHGFSTAIEPLAGARPRPFGAEDGRRSDPL